MKRKREPKMKGLNKDQKAQLETVRSELDMRFESLEQAIENYNSVIREAKDLRDEIVAAVDDYTSERSEKWQESERAGEYESFKSQWEDLELEEVEIPDGASPLMLDDLPTEV